MVNGWKIGYMPTGSFEKMEPETVCEELKKIGYDAVEWTQFFAAPDTHSDAQLHKLVKVTQEYGMEVSEVVVQKDLILTDEALWRKHVDLIKDCIRRYAQVGIRTVNLFTGPIPWCENPLQIGGGISEGDAWKMLFAAFDELVPLAEECGMNLAVENVWGMLCHDVYTMQYLISHYRSPYLGVNYDPSHDVLAGHLDMEWLVAQWGDNIKHIHLKDAVGIQQKGKFLFPLLGEGEVDWKAFCRALQGIGYQGVMSVEFESFGYVDKIWGGDWRLAARSAYENLKILLPARE